MPDGVSFSRLQAVLFDVDGTLVDTVAGCVEGLHDAFTKYGHRDFSHQEIRAMVGVPLHTQLKYAMGESANDERIEEAIRYTLSRYAIYLAEEKYFEPAIKALQLAHESGLKTALVTSKNAREIATFFPSFSGRHWVDTVVCASDVPNPKPSPDSAVLACKQLQVEPTQAVMVGDSIFDMRCARAAGVAQIAVSYGSTDHETLLAEAPHLAFSTPDELLNWFIQGIRTQNEKETTETRRIG